MTVRLYITSLSNPSYAAVGMLAHKRLAHRRIDLLTGFHPYLVRAAGFEGRTVPALELEDGRHVQGSLEISQEAIYDYAAMAYYWGRGWWS